MHFYNNCNNNNKIGSLVINKTTRGGAAGASAAKQASSYRIFICNMAAICWRRGAHSATKQNMNIIYVIAAYRRTHRCNNNSVNGAQAARGVIVAARENVIGDGKRHHRMYARLKLGSNNNGSRDGGREK